jgi:carbonic anhydrase
MVPDAPVAVNIFNLKPLIMITKKIYLVCILLGMAFCSCNSKHAAGTAIDSTQKADTGTQRNNPSGAIIGILQSPIDIIDSNTVQASLLPLKFGYTPTKMYVENDKKAIRVAPLDAGDSSNYLIFNKSRYNFVDFHFHHKSEHLINGVADSMEVHIIYENKATKALVVVGLLISQGSTPNAVLTTVWNEFPPQGNYERHDLSAPVNIAGIINYSTADYYYSYVGSLTTPDYAEVVAWIVMKKRLILTASQIQKFAAYYPDNARKSYPVNNRLILVNKR